MWARNLLFVGFVAVAALTLRAAVLPLHTAGRDIPFDLGITTSADFLDTVRRVDESFREDWRTRDLTPAPPAADLAVARRLSLALAGTIPSLEEIRRFEAAPPDRRLAGWANHVLRDRRSADHLAERLARVYVGTEEGPPIVYRKRRFVAWLSDEFRRNTPYSEVVRRMIAGSGLNTDAPGVNFIAAAYDPDNKAVDAEQLAVRTARAFLGLRIDCAQCHDHFLEPSWRQSDFQSLAAFYGQARQEVTHVTDDPGREYRFEDRKAGGTRAVEPAVPFLPKLLPADGTRRERLARWATDPRNRYFARAAVNRFWAMLFNRPLTRRVEADTLDDDGPPALGILADDFAAHGHDLRRLILLIASTEVFRLDSAAPHELTADHDAAWAAFPLARLRPDQVIGAVFQAGSVRTIDRDSHVLVRLATQFGERDFVARYGDPGDDEFDGRGGTIPQRLLMMNGSIVNEQAKNDFLSAAGRIALLAPDDRAAVETAYLAVLTRRPTDPEASHFTARLTGTRGEERGRRVSDLFWVLFNATEMSWNH